MDQSTGTVNFAGDLYDLKTGLIRPCVGPDMISRSTNYKLPVEDDPIIQENIMKLIERVFDNHQPVNYLLIWLASCLDGSNSKELFHLLTGEGRNVS